MYNIKEEKMTRIKVLYDITVLGLGQYFQMSRTGVFRVTEEIACGLSLSNECDLDYCASNSAEHWYMASEYLRLNSRINAKKGLCETKLLKVGKCLWKKAVLKKASSVFNRAVGVFPKYLMDVKRLKEAEIFHAGFYYPFPEQVKAAKHLKKFLFIHDLIPILFPQLFSGPNAKMLKNALDNLDPDTRILCNSHSTKNDLCNYLPNLDPSRVFVTHLGVSSLLYPCTDPVKNKYIRAKYNLPDGHYIVSIGTLEPRKNITHLIRCFENLIQQEHIEDLHLVLVGTKGWKYDDIFAKIDNHNKLKKRVIVTGYVEDEDLASLYSGALTFVSPSLYEGFGLPALEAMRCGTPAITSNTSSFPEVVGDAGIMVDPKDGDALCQSILKLYKNPSVRETMSQKGTEKAKLFTWEKCVRNIIDAYKVALKT